MIWKTGNKFSAIPIDQVHKQNNALVKGDGGAIGLTKHAAALRRWTVGGPEIAKVIQNFDNGVDFIPITHPTSHHHDASPKVQANFVSYVAKLEKKYSESGNPFQDATSDLVILHTGDIVDRSVIQTLNNIYEIGTEQYNTFVRERITNRFRPLSDPIKRNKFQAILMPRVKARSTVLTQVSSLKQDFSLFARFYIASQSREGSLDNFFLA